MPQQRLHLRLRLPHPPERVFAHFADHEGLARWLGVDRVELLRAVPDGGAGTVRRVHLHLPGGLPTSLEETIERAEPPRRLVYRGKPGLLLNRYQGDLRFPVTPDGCSVEWTIHLATRLPGADQALALHLTRLFWEGLRRLESLLGPGPGVPRTGRLVRAGGSGDIPCCEAAEEEVYGRLLREAQQTGVEQTRRALALSATGEIHDARYWFLRASSLATTFLLDRVQSGCFLHPCWVLRLLVTAHRYMERSLVAAATPGGTPEGHWRSWLRATANASSWWPTPIQGAVHSIAKGTNLHVAEDYPRALAELFARTRHLRCAIRWTSYLDDWRAMAPAYDQAWALIRPELRLLLTPREQLATTLGTSQENDLLLERLLLGLPRERELAWERGLRLITLLHTLERPSTSSIPCTRVDLPAEDGWLPRPEASSDRE